MRCACCYLKLRNFSVDLRLRNYYGRPGRRAPTSSLRGNRNKRPVSFDHHPLFSLDCRLNWWRGAGSQGFVNPPFPRFPHRLQIFRLCALYPFVPQAQLIWLSDELFVPCIFVVCIQQSIQQRIDVYRSRFLREYRSAGMLLRHDFLYSAVIPVNGRKLNPLSVLFLFPNVLSCFNMQDATDSQLIAYITFLFCFLI